MDNIPIVRGRFIVVEVNKALRCLSFYLLHYFVYVISAQIQENGSRDIIACIIRGLVSISRTNGLTSSGLSPIGGAHL